jgi:hypothetical protein
MVDTVGLSDLSDDLMLCILKRLDFSQLAALHVVNSRFNRLLSRPDPSIRVFGSPAISVDALCSNNSHIAVKRYAWKGYLACLV